jgi:hypothetical protein
MDQSERERLLLFRDAIDDAGVARAAKEDALRRLEEAFENKPVDRIAARDHLERVLRPVSIIGTESYAMHLSL